MCRVFYFALLPVSLVIHINGDNCYQKGLTITPYNIFNVNSSEVGFNASFQTNRSGGELCLLETKSSIFCQSINGFFVVFEHDALNDMAVPKLNVSEPFIFVYKSSLEDDNFKCMYHPPVSANITHYRIETLYPTPKMDVSAVPLGINITWTLDNIQPFTANGTNLQLQIFINGSRLLDINQSKLYKMVNINTRKIENTTIEAYFTHNNKKGTGENYVFVLSKQQLISGDESVSFLIAWIILGISCPFILTIIIWYCRRRTLPPHESNINRTGKWHSEYNPLYFIESASTAKCDNSFLKMTIKANELIHVKKLGEGNFGQVALSTWRSKQHPQGILVAVKTFKSEHGGESSLAQYKNEIEIFHKVGCHPNIVKFLGYNASVPWFIVTEFMEQGDLASYLRSRRKKCRSYFRSISKLNNLEEESQPLQSDMNDELTNKDLEYFGKEIATGMLHLEHCQVVHRDLAARNVLLGRNKVVKITDFGLSREGVYFNSSKTELPIRWMAPETFLETCMCSSKSDVWSFGVVLWEIGTLGALPYQNMTIHQIISFLKSEQRLFQPELVRNSLYKLMLKCWAYNHNDRPSFQVILDEINAMSAYFEFTDLLPNYEFPRTYEEIKPV